MAKERQYLANFKLWIRKEHSVSFWSMIKFSFIFLCRYLFLYLPFYLSIRLTIPVGTKFSFTQWWTSAGGAFLMVIISYFWDNYRDRAKNKTIESDKIIYDCIGGAIQELHEIKANKPFDNQHYIDEILVYIEKVIVSIFNATGIPCGTLCVNFMVKEGDRLKLIKFAAKFQDRDKPEITFNENEPLPGAPEAWVFKKTIYINDIGKEQYKPYFPATLKFKSFISIPVLNNGTVIGIINVDSNIKDQFVSEDFISKKIMTKINPLLLLFVLGRELFKDN